MSTLAYTLRDYSPSRLSDDLSEESQRRWLKWLEEHERGLQPIAGFLRVSINLAFFICVALWIRERLGMALEFPVLVIAGATALLLLLIFAVGIPHALSIHAGETVLARSLPLLLALRFTLYPVAALLAAVEFVTRRLLGIADPTDEAESERAEQEILEAVSDGELHGVFDEDQREMIESVVALHDTAVTAIMTPRTEIIAARADASFEELSELIQRTGHSRLPVYEESLDHLIGVLYAKDLIGHDPDNPLDVRKIVRSVPYVPESKTIDQLLRDLRQQRVHMAIVLDEYGGTAGLVTIEDIIEEVVGEIDDEYDKDQPPELIKVDEHTLEVDGRVHIDEINEKLDIELPEDGDYETIAGFVFATLGKIPTPGEEFTHNNVHFRIMDAETRRVNRVQIHVERAGKAS